MQLKNKVIALTSVMIGLTACHSGTSNAVNPSNDAMSLGKYVSTLDYASLDIVRASASFQQTMQVTRTTFLESMTMSFYAGANCSGTLESSLVFTGGISLPAGNYTTSNASAYWDCSHYSGTSGVGCAAEFTDTRSMQMVYYTSEYGVIGMCANSKVGHPNVISACTSATNCGFVAPETSNFGGWTDQVPIPNSWAWMGGSNQGNQNGVYPANPYPSAGYESAGNVPRARYGSMGWTNESGLWLFGGVGRGGSTDYLNDLWLYNPTTHQWAWMSGSNQGNQKGIYPANSYPAQGYESAGNTPGSRFGSVTWIDESGLWLFGGSGYDIDTDSAVNFLNDLWLYNPTTHQWGWMSGSNQGNQNGIYPANSYPSVDYESAGNMPGARRYSVSWTTESGLWLFGGYGSGGSYLNDLWLYNPTTHQWAWMSGSNQGNQKGIYPANSYPAQGYESAGNTPGSRFGSVTWIDESGLWLFGGAGYDIDSGSAVNFLNDLWLYNPTTHQWAWMSGSNQAGQIGIYPAAPYPSVDYESAGNMPGARRYSVSWTTESGLWLFGGYGRGSYLNDLWLYNTKTHQWAWMGGSKQINQYGVYPIGSGFESAANMPGSRYSSISWSTESGLWLFGGIGYDIDTGSASNYLNDLWLFNPPNVQSLPPT